MSHSVEQFYKKAEVLHSKALELHRERYRVQGTYDKVACQAILDDIQSMAKLIAEDRQGEEIKTEMDEWKK